MQRPEERQGLLAEVLGQELAVGLLCVQVRPAIIGIARVLQNRSEAVACTCGYRCTKWPPPDTRRCGRSAEVGGHVLLNTGYVRVWIIPMCYSCNNSGAEKWNVKLNTMAVQHEEYEHCDYV